MSYAASAGSRAAPLLARGAADVEAGAAGGGGEEAAFTEASNLVRDALIRIRSRAADISKETRSLETSKAPSGCRSRVYDKFRAAKDDVASAHDRLKGMSPGAAAASPAAADYQRMRHQKQLGELLAASTELEAAEQAFEAAAARREAQLQAARKAEALELQDHGAASLVSTAASEGRSQQLQQLDLAERAEVDLHSELVNDFAQDVSHLHNEITGLQRAMVDLAAHAHSQGETLDCIVAHTERASSTTGQAREQLVQANQAHGRGTRLLYCLLGLALIMAIAVVIVAFQKSKGHHR